MRRSDVACQVLKLTPDTIETAFPTKNAIDVSHLSRVKVEVWDLSAKGCGYRFGSVTRREVSGCIVFPLPRYFTGFIDDKCAKHGPVDCNGIGGEILVPVCHPVWSDWPQPPIPVVNDRPVHCGHRPRFAPLLVYPAFRIDEKGRLAIRWDQKLHALPRGRYEARIIVDGMVCGLFEIDKNYCCDIDMAGMESRELEDVAERAPRPEGITDMFDEIYDWTSTTTCQLEAGDTQVKVKDAGPLCSSVLCRQPELVITDGVTKEVLTFIGCLEENTLQIERSGTSTIQAGAVIRFEWTTNNVLNAAEGC